MTRPSGSRRAEAFRVVGITSPLALRGLSRALRVTPFSTTSRRAAVNSRVSSGRDEPRQRLLDQLVRAEAEELRDGVVGLEDLAFQVGDEHRVGGVLDQALGVGPRLVQLAHVAEDADGPDRPARPGRAGRRRSASSG